MKSTGELAALAHRHRNRLLAESHEGRGGMRARLERTRDHGYAAAQFRRGVVVTLRLRHADDKALDRDDAHEDRQRFHAPFPAQILEDRPPWAQAAARLMCHRSAGGRYLRRWAAAHRLRRDGRRWARGRPRGCRRAFWFFRNEIRKLVLEHVLARLRQP